MKKITIMTKAAALLVSVGMLTVYLCGCTSQKTSVASPSDAVSSEVEEPVKHVEASEAVSVLINGEKVDEVFMLQYNWYGKEFVAEDSFNKIMMDSYAPAGKRAPYAKNESEVSFAFVSSEEIPSDMKVTQYANTVRANSGIPYDTVEIELISNEDGTFGFAIDYRRFSMYYYILECEWENGNSAKFAFAVEKTKNQ